MRNRCRAALAVAPLVMVASSLFQSLAAAQNGPLVYRRVLVPEDDLHSQIRGLLPLARDEFERRLAVAARKGEANSPPLDAQLEQATFRARLDGPELVAGRSELNITCRGEGPALVPLEPCNVVIESAAWQGAEQPAAIVGVDAGGRLWCRAEASGTLKLGWSQPASRVESGLTTFELQLPAAPRRRLEIVAPSGFELASDSGLITSAAAAGEPTGRVWTIDLNADPRTVLHVRASGAAGNAGPLVVAREATNYAVHGSAVDLLATLTLDVLRQPVTELEFAVDAAIHVTEIRAGSEALPLSIEPSGAQSTVRARVPAGLSGTEQIVSIAGSAEWPGGGRWTLPRIELRGAEYQE